MRRFLVVGVLLALFGFVAGAASGATEAELEEIKEEISRLSDQIESAQSAKSQAAEDLLATNARLDELASQLAEAEGVLASLEADIAAGESELAEVRAMLDHFQSALASTRLKLGEARSALSVQVVELYMNASTAGTRLLAFSDASEATIGFAYVDGAMGDSSRLLHQLDILEAEEERQEEILDEQRQSQEELLAQLAVQREEQQVEVARVDGLRADAAREAESAQALVASLTSDIAHFEEHKDGLEADAAALERELAARGSQGERPSGPLARPVPGPVTSGFGYRVHPIFGTRRLHTGWDMSAAAGSPISAAGDGVVVSAGGRGGYGNAVVIDHGGGLATLYAHQSSMAVSAGEQVSQGQVIGYVGCTGYCTGPHLHFEVRVNGAPVDPSGYVG
ncbi:MAG TPA: peptidoglycan DD-metalloendopeptidase family protein [Acidimicrobiia bacterium]|nr:peptidoglycan DD-metalloendopeptidase family protein [Acidimicrobiia bacterium]